LSDFQTKEEVTGSIPVISSIKNYLEKKVKKMKTKINGVNYQIYTDEKNKKVIAVCRYAGRYVKAVATCSPEDEFNVATGTELAVARCEWKAAKLKLQNAGACYMTAAKAADEAAIKLGKMKDYYMDSVDQLDEAGAAMQAVIEKLK
jgi:hypothetical protein